MVKSCWSTIINFKFKLWLCEIASYICGRVDFYFLFLKNLEGEGKSVGLTQSSEYNTVGVECRVDI